MPVLSWKCLWISLVFKYSLNNHFKHQLACFLFIDSFWSRHLKVTFPSSLTVRFLDMF